LNLASDMKKRGEVPAKPRGLALTFVEEEDDDE
jgi:hypothetical protein